MDTSTNWFIQCVPDGEDLEPSPEELESMYQSLENGNGAVLELQWKCPGRRLPSPTITDNASVTEASEKDIPSKNIEFDFMDEVSTPTIRVRTQNTFPKTVAKKKTANFAGILDAMKKHGRIAQQPSASSTSKDGSSATGS